MITVFGSVNLDQIGRVPRLPRPGETIGGGAFATAPGGKGANQALAARRAGRDVRLVGAVGDDVFADQALALLRSDGVDLSSVRITRGATGIAMILVDDNGENVIAVIPGANAALTGDDATTAIAAMSAGDILLLQQEIPPAANRRALDRARATGITSILNTAPFLPTTAALVPIASIVVANEAEFASLSGSHAADLDDAMRALARSNAQTIVVTLGAAGARAADGRSIIRVPAAPIAAIDTVGAGDTFCGYLAAGLDAGAPLEAALRRAALAASLACLKPGAQPAIPTSGEVDAFVARA